MLTKKDDMLKLMPMTHELSESVVDNKNISLGEGTFGIVTVGHFHTLNVPCAIKSGKDIRHFNPYFEARVLQNLSGSRFFPYVFGVMSSKSLVMELIAEKKVDGQWHVPTIYSEKSRFTMPVWNRICMQVSEAIKFMHNANILHNDIKSNNIILKVMNKDEDICPKICDFGKATHKMKPLQYNLTDKEKLKYNAKYLYIAYEL